MEYTTITTNIEYSQSIAEYNVLCSYIDYVHKLGQYVECYSIIDCNNMDRFFTESIGDIIPADIKRIVVDKNGKLTPKSIMKAFIRAAIAGVKMIISKFKHRIYFNKLQNAKCTHVTVAFDLDEMSNALTNIGQYISETKTFYEEMFGATKTGTIKTLASIADIDDFSKITSYHNQRKLSNQQFRDMMGSGDATHFRNLIDDHLSPFYSRNPLDITKLGIITNKAKDYVKKIEDKGQLLTQQAVEQYKQRLLEKNPNADVSNISSIIGVDEKHVGGKSKNFKYRYTKEDAIKKFKHLNDLSDKIRIAAKDMYLSLQQTYQSLEKLQDMSDFNDDRHEMVGDDSVKIMKAIKPSIDNTQRMYLQLVEYQMLCTNQYGVFWLVDYS